MKKRIFSICMMVLLIFGLTACGKEVSDSVEILQQKKNELCIETAASYLVPYMVYMFADDEMAKTYQDCYNVHELEIVVPNEIYNLTAGKAYLEVEGNAILNGIVSFNSGLKTLGQVSILSDQATAEAKDDQIIVTVPLQGTNTKKNGTAYTASVEVIFSNDIMTKVESCTLNIDQSIGELMGKAGMDTAMGMGTVFSILILISILIWLLGFIPKLMDKTKKKAAPVQEEKKTSVDNTIAQIIANEENQVDDLELVAVIAAAIAASEGKTSTDGFVVRSIIRR